MSNRLSQAAHRIRIDAHAVWLTARDPRTPRLARLIGFAVAAYALSPIDLIPDFVPILGLLDDIILLPIGIWLVLRLTPAPLFAEHRAAAEVASHRPVSRTGTIMIIAIWLAAAALVGLYLMSWSYW